MNPQENKRSIGALPESTSTFYEDKLFEKALVRFPDGTAGRWQKIAGAVPGMTPEQAWTQYQALVHDLHEIEAGRVEIPTYSDEAGDESFLSCESEEPSQISSKNGEGERKRGTPWTEEEHRRFLHGLDVYGKGDWRSISRNSVITRTPTQVASHAQKYFLRQSAEKKERKRSSIHDITTTVVVPPPPATVVVQPPPATVVVQPPPTTVMVLPPPTTNFSGGLGGAPPQMGYEYQQSFGHTI